MLPWVEHGTVSRKTALILTFSENNWLLLLPPRRMIVLVVYCLEKRVVKVVFLLVFEKHIHLFIRLIRTSLREPLSFVLPCSIGAGTRGRARNECGNDCIFVCFLLLYVSHIRVYRVCLSTAITDNPNSVSYQEIAYFYTFFYFFFRLKFSKTPFHVVLSKNKTNTKKKNIISHY